MSQNMQNRNITYFITPRITTQVLDLIHLLPYYLKIAPPHVGAHTQANQATAHTHVSRMCVQGVILVISVISKTYSYFLGNKVGNKRLKTVIFAGAGL